MRRLAGVAAVLLLSACGERPPGAGDGDGGPVVYEADALVLDEADRAPVLCLGAVADSLPPQCQGVPVVGWDWAAVEGEEMASETTWGSFHVVGTYDGSAFTVTNAGPPEPFEPSGGDPVDTPCPEPDGGWMASDPSLATEDVMLELMRTVEDEPDFAGFSIDYVQEPVGEVVAEPGGIIANVAFTSDLEGHDAEIRELWGGPLCLVEHEHTYDELRRIQRELGNGGAAELGLESTWSGVSNQDNVVELGVIVADDALRAAVEARFGEGTVLLHPALVPVDAGSAS